MIKNNLDKLCQVLLLQHEWQLGFPKDFEVLVRDVKLQNGAGFITVYLGKILTMPGLPKSPNYEKIDLDDSLKITGLF